MKQHYLSITLAEEEFYLLPEKAIFRPAKQQLILSDIHLGKTTHFRKQGIALPMQSNAKDIEKITALLDTWQPQTVLILGDLFHSNYNKEWEFFASLLNEHPLVQFTLVEGNHDILEQEAYRLPNLEKVKTIEEDNFIFSHKPIEEDTTKLNFCGHIHPGIRIEGIAKQSAKLPCFYNNHKHFILPAFGYLTGLYLLQQEEKSTYYVVAKDMVIEV